MGNSSSSPGNDFSSREAREATREYHKKRVIAEAGNAIASGVAAGASLADSSGYSAALLTAKSAAHAATGQLHHHNVEVCDLMDQGYSQKDAQLISTWQNDPDSSDALNSMAMEALKRKKSG